MTRSHATPPAQSAEPRWRRVRQWLQGSEAWAEDLLQHLGLDHPPVDPFEVARRLDIRIVPSLLLSNLGEAHISGDEAVIRLHQDDAPLRQRFTVAHELAHILLHPAGTYGRPRPGAAAASQELEANRFAASLLMPAHWVDTVASQAARDDAPTPERIQRVASTFRTSPEATTRRLRELGWLRR